GHDAACACPDFFVVGTTAAARSFIDGVTAGVTGAIAGAAVLMSARILTSIEAVVISVLVIRSITRLRIPEPIMIVAAACSNCVMGWLFTTRSTPGFNTRATKHVHGTRRRAGLSERV
ncbi:MAG TPA: hypothetical protein VHM24_13035, partial [Gemmatimonadaceae bacterium]|nr:hypothetical protein [Gemmatimonadaceae bacterium]